MIGFFGFPTKMCVSSCSNSTECPTATPVCMTKPKISASLEDEADAKAPLGPKGVCVAASYDAESVTCC